VEFGLKIPKTALFDVVGFGLNAVDHLCIVPREAERGEKLKLVGFQRSPGGQAASAMVQCARLGLRTKYVGKVGGDAIGDYSLETIQSEGVDVSDVPAVPGATNQLAMIIVDETTGERTIFWDRPDGIATQPDEISPEKIAVGRTLLVDGHDAPAAAKAARLARDRGIPVVMDAETVKEGTHDCVAHTDLLVASSRFPSQYAGCADDEEALSRILKEGPSIAVMTRGAHGAIAIAKDGTKVESPGFKVNVVDTTGAGDIFHGAFVYGLLAGWTVEHTLDFSNAAAALNCTAVGARGGAAHLEEIEALMREQGRL
jgi:sulfofructose kinase